MGALFGGGIAAVVAIATANIVLLSPIAFTILTITPVAFAYSGYQSVKESLSKGHKLQAVVRGVTAIFSVVGSVKLIKDVKIKISNSANKGGSKADLGNKLDYQFGKAKGDKHNIDRTLGLKAEMDKLGFEDTPENRAFLSNIIMTY